MEVQILTAKEYSRKFKVNSKYVSPETIKRMCLNNLLPSWATARLIQGSSFGQGIWIIVVQNKKQLV